LMNEDTSYLTRPYATTDFLQPWLFTDYTTNQIYEHIKMLKTAGYKNIVLQNVATISGGYKNDAKITSAWYETTLSTDTESLDIYNPTLLGTLIDAVTSLDMGIYIGPVITNDWLNGGYTNSTWIYSNAALINGIIKDIYSKYGNYSCFKGWYLGFDIYANNHQYEEHWIDLFNYILNFITTLESTGISHPVMITPSFNDSYQMKSSEVYAFWKNVVQNTNFRTNDIICFFDGLGTSHIKPNIITNYIIETKKAINSCPTDLDFWLCVENFRDINTSVKPADLVRYIIQLELCAKLTDTLASYSYSHYYNPKYVDSTDNTDYLTYLTESASNIKVNDNSLNKTTTSNSRKKNNNKTNSNKKHTNKSTGNSTNGISLEFENTNIATPTGGYIYKDKNGELAPIPSGFTVSSYANTINEGLVIKDKNQNEYVWIPVKDGIMSN
ncbi:MAG: DUF4434 domain-containing protein, partial [Clostridia bacterium]|nr:DUF4434 domain-containing protein [Clostridia bacterium]